MRIVSKVLLLAAASLVPAASAQATVTYTVVVDYDSNVGDSLTFQYKSPSFITSETSHELSPYSCTAPRVEACDNLLLGFLPIQEINFPYENPPIQYYSALYYYQYSGIFSGLFYDLGTFTKPGTYAETKPFFGNVATLTISEDISAVPEPATWGLMIGGFGMIGSTMRYRRRPTTTAHA